MRSGLGGWTIAGGAVLLAGSIIGCTAPTPTGTEPAVVSTSSPASTATTAPTERPTSTPVVVPTLPPLPGLPDAYPGPTPERVYRILGMGAIIPADIDPSFLPSLSPDGKTLVVQTSLGFAAYSVASLERAWFSLRRSGGADRIIWSPDSTKFAAYNPWHVDIWDAASGQRPRSIEFADIYPDLVPSPYEISSFGGVAWSPDGKTLAIRSHEVLLWDMDTGASDRRLLIDDDGREVFNHMIDHLQWSPDGRHLAADIGGQEAVICGVESGEIENRVRAMAWSWSPDLSRVLTVKIDQNHQRQSHTLYDMATGTELQSFGPTVGISPDWKLIADSGEDEIRIYHTDDGSLLEALPTPRSEVSRLSWSPDGTLLASMTDAKLSLWDIQTATEVIANSQVAVKSAPSLRQLRSFTIKWSPDSSLLFTRMWGEHVFSMWDTQTGARIRAIPGDTGLVFLPGQSQYFFQSTDGELAVWDARSGGIIQTVSTTASFDTLYWSADGKQVASAYGDEFVIWDVDSAMPVRVVDRQGLSEFTPVEKSTPFSSTSPDGSRTATTDDSGITLSDTSSGQVIRKIPLAHECEGPCLKLSWSPSGNYLTATFGTTLFVWNSQNGGLLHRTDGAWRDQRPTFSPNGELMSFDVDGALYLWKLP